MLEADAIHYCQYIMIKIIIYNISNIIPNMIRKMNVIARKTRRRKGVLEVEKWKVSIICTINTVTKID